MGVREGGFTAIPGVVPSAGAVRFGVFLKK